MSPTRSGYKELGFNLVEPLRDQPRKPRGPPMGEEKKDEGAGDPIKMLLKEALEKQRNTVMDNFSRILQWILTGSASTSSSHSGGATPFKVQVNFDIDPGGYRGLTTFSKWLKTVFWPFWQFTIFSRF